MSMIDIKTLISVIVPVYNVENYLPYCIESICRQKYKDIEIILVNDGSTDGSLEICMKYREIDNRIKIVDKSNGGLLSARKEGVEHATSEYISFVDGDDYIDENLYFRVAEIIQQYNPDIVSYGLTCVDEYGTKAYADDVASGYYNKEKMEEEIYPYMMLGNGRKKNAINAGIVLKVVKKHIVKPVLEAIDVKINVAEDASISYPCIYNAQSIYCDSQNVGYLYRILNGSMSHRFDINWYENVLRYKGWMNLFFENCNSDYIKKGIDYEVFFLFRRGINMEIDNLISREDEINCNPIYSYLPEIKEYLKLVDVNKKNFSKSDILRYVLIRLHMLEIYIRVKRIFKL